MVARVFRLVGALLGRTRREVSNNDPHINTGLGAGFNGFGVSDWGTSKGCLFHVELGVKSFNCLFPCL